MILFNLEIIKTDCNGNLIGQVKLNETEMSQLRDKLNLISEHTEDENTLRNYKNILFGGGF